MSQKLVNWSVGWLVGREGWREGNEGGKGGRGDREEGREED